MRPAEHRDRRSLYPWLGVLTGIVLVVTAAWAVEFIPGDVNDDGVFDIADPTVLRRELAGLEPGILQMCLAELPATGQVTCSDSTGSAIPCAGTGHDGDVQAGAVLAYQDNGDGTVTDLHTGLMWEKLSDDGSVHDLDNTYTWDLAFSVKVATLNIMAFAGHADWRLPNFKELVGILDVETSTPTASAAFNTDCASGCSVTTCSCTFSTGYWSSTSVPSGALLAYFVNFDSARVSLGSKTTSLLRVRAVRGP